MFFCRPSKLTEFDEDLKLRGEEELNLFLPPPTTPPRPSPPPIDPIVPPNPRLDEGGLRSCSDCR